MKPAALFLSICFLSGCGKHSHTDNATRTISVESSQQLSPKDLGIQKYRFAASPKAGEVAIFRSRKRSRLELPHRHAYDQIYWTNGGEAVEDVVIAPLSFYLGFPESAPGDREKSFRDSWRLRAGGFAYDINEYSFLSSGTSTFGDRATARFVYTKNMEAKSEDLVFEFEMFVLSFEEAKKIHPELAKTEAKSKKEGTTRLGSAFILEEKEEDAQ